MYYSKAGAARTRCVGLCFERLQSDSRIRAVPEGKKVVVRLAGLVHVAGQHGRAREAEVRERVERRGRRPRRDGRGCSGTRRRRPAVLQLQVRLAAQIGGPELRRRRVIVRLDRVQQLERARRFTAPERERRGRHGQLNPRRQRRVRKSTGQFGRQARRLVAGATQRQRAARPLEREIVAAELEPGRDLPPRVGALARDRMRFGILHRPLRAELAEVLAHSAPERRAGTARGRLETVPKTPTSAPPSWTPTSRPARCARRSSSRAMRRRSFSRKASRYAIRLRPMESISAAQSPRAGAPCASVEPVERDQRSREVSVRRHEPRVEADGFAESAGRPARADRTRRTRGPGC